MTMRLRLLLQATLKDNNLRLCSSLLHSTMDGFFLSDGSRIAPFMYLPSKQYTLQYALRENFKIL